MFFPFSRVVAVLMAGVLCALLATMAVARHLLVLAVFVAIVYVAYAIGNVVLWQRLRRRE